MLHTDTVILYHKHYNHYYDNIVIIMSHTGEVVYKYFCISLIIHVQS